MSLWELLYSEQSLQQLRVRISQLIFLWEGLETTKNSISSRSLNWLQLDTSPDTSGRPNCSLTFSIKHNQHNCDLEEHIWKIPSKKAAITEHQLNSISYQISQIPWPSNISMFSHKEMSCSFSSNFSCSFWVKKEMIKIQKLHFIRGFKGQRSVKEYPQTPRKMDFCHHMLSLKSLWHLVNWYSNSSQWLLQHEHTSKHLQWKLTHHTFHITVCHVECCSKVPWAPIVENNVCPALFLTAGRGSTHSSPSLAYRHNQRQSNGGAGWKGLFSTIPFSSACFCNTASSLFRSFSIISPLWKK